MRIKHATVLLMLTDKIPKVTKSWVGSKAVSGSVWDFTSNGSVMARTVRAAPARRGPVRTKTIFSFSTSCLYPAQITSKDKDRTAVEIRSV